MGEQRGGFPERELSGDIGDEHFATDCCGPGTERLGDGGGGPAAPDENVAECDADLLFDRSPDGGREQSARVLRRRRCRPLAWVLGERLESGHPTGVGRPSFADPARRSRPSTRAIGRDTLSSRSKVRGRSAVATAARSASEVVGATRARPTADSSRGEGTSRERNHGKRHMTSTDVETSSFADEWARTGVPNRGCRRATSATSGRGRRRPRSMIRGIRHDSPRLSPATSTQNSEPQVGHDVRIRLWPSRLTRRYRSCKKATSAAKSSSMMPG